MAATRQDRGRCDFRIYSDLLCDIIFAKIGSNPWSLPSEREGGKMKKILLESLVGFLLILFLRPNVYACPQDSFGPCVFDPSGNYLGNYNNQPWDPNNLNNPNRPTANVGEANPLGPYGSGVVPWSPYYQSRPQPSYFGDDPGSRYSEPLGSGWGALGFALGEAMARREAGRQEQEREGSRGKRRRPTEGLFHFRIARKVKH